MNYNFLDFTRVEPLKGMYSGVNDIFAGMLKARQEKQGLEKGQHENAYLKAKAESAPELVASEIERNKAGSLFTAMQKSLMEKELPYAGDQAKANLAKTIAEATIAGQTPMERQLIGAGYTPGTPEYEAAAKQFIGVQEAPGVEIPGSLSKLPISERTKVKAEMRDNLTRMDKVVQVNKRLKEMKELNNKYPHLWKYWFQAFESNGEATLKSSLLKASGIVNDKDYEALTKMNKLSNQIALLGGEGMGKNFTDAKLKAIQAAKPNTKNPSKTNDSIIDEMLYENSYAEPFRNQLRKGFKEDFPVYNDPDIYRKREYETPAGEEPQGENAQQGKVNEYGQPIKTYINESTGESFTGTINEARGRGIIK